MRQTHYYIYTLSLTMLVACGSLPENTAIHKQRIKQSPANSQARDVKSILQRANNMLGKPYRYGGRSPKRGFDCSGLVYYSFNSQVPRSSRAQYRASQAVKKNQLRPGDLVFFKLGFSKVSHVGIYTGKGQFIHAPSTGKQVMRSSLSEDFWRKRFLRGGRFPNIIK